MIDQSGMEGRISFLNVGTKMLLKDTMDQYLRTLGDFKTHYAANMTSALRAFSETTIHVVITEVDLGDASAFRLIKELGGDTGGDDLFVVLALEERSDALMALAAEIEAHSVLVKPFSAADLNMLVERYKSWRLLPKEPWQLLVREGQLSARDKKFREAETNYLEAIKASPGNPTPVFKAGQYYLSKPDYAMAEKLFKKAIEFKPDYVQAISSLGSLYLTKHDLEKAEQFLKQAQEISPLNPDRLVEMVRLYVDRCVDACKSSLRIDASSTPARFLLGKLLALQKDYIGTIREIERALPNLRDEAKLEAQTFMALARKLGSLAK